MSADARCTEDGPFFPQTPRYVIQNGMSIDQDILKSPDWLVILLLLATVIIIFIILVIALVSWASSMILRSDKCEMNQANLSAELYSFSDLIP